MNKKLFPHTDREDILVANQKRDDIRQKLKGDAASAREELSPRNQVNRLIAHGKDKVDDVVQQAGETVRRTAPAIGLASLGTLLFLGRKPISRWISQLRRTKNK